jgi:hypothetical protein
MTGMSRRRPQTADPLGTTGPYSTSATTMTVTYPS